MTDRIVYAVPDINAPIGGVRVLYRHVELLVAAGQNAVVWSPEKRAGHDWFSSPAPVVVGTSLELDASDLFVIPEGCVMRGVDPAPGCRKVIFNQNHLYTFANVPWDAYPLWDPEPPVWVSSVATRDVLTRLSGFLPIRTVFHIPLAVDTDLFRPSGHRERKVSWMPRKRPFEAALLRALIAADDRFAGVVVAQMDGLTEQQTAAELGSSSVFVALGRDEGFGLPVAEALAAGCVVVGYPAGGGVELFGAPGTYAVADTDVLAMIEQIAVCLGADLPEHMRAQHRAWVERNYPAGRQSAQLMTAVAAARELPASAGTARHPFR